MIPKPPFPWDLTPEQEIADFQKLKPRLAEVWDALVMREEEPHTAVVVPSLTLDQSELRKISGASFYEERLLFLLIRLRNPRARMVVIACFAGCTSWLRAPTSSPVPDRKRCFRT